MSIIVNRLSYSLPNKEYLFNDINFTVSDGNKLSLIGNNGVGKSTLLKIIAGSLSQSSGEVICNGLVYYVPQHFGQYNDQTIAQALNIDCKIKALHAILAGDASVENFTLLDDDWGIEERYNAALSSWGLSEFDLSREMSTLSGGEKTKVFLAGISIHSPSVLLMDEPSNHLDKKGRALLYDFIKSYKSTLLVVSHDRTLLNMLDDTYELFSDKVEVYGGNYDFYKEVKEQKLQALQAQAENREKALNEAKRTARKALERKQKESIRSDKAVPKKGIARIMINTLKNSAENSSAKIQDIHEKKVERITDELRDVRQQLSAKSLLKLNFENSNSHTGRLLVTVEDVNFSYPNSPDLLWNESFNFQIRTGDRLLIEGANGRGKTTLLKLVLGEIPPVQGRIVKSSFSQLYIDQDYSLINNNLTVFEQMQEFNSRGLFEHELKTILNRYLFSSGSWDKTCGKLSGGEKMKLLLACLMVSNNVPDLFVLDEPTNNLDIQSLEILTSALKEYKGALIIISHDSYFINEMAINQSIVI